jgi:carboxyl-terminal processing protease
MRGRIAAGPAAGNPRAVVSVFPPPNREVRAGETLNWIVTVENKGDAPIRQLRAWTNCEKNPLLDRREFLFGTVAPGEKRSWAVQVKMPRGLDTRRDEVVLHFEDQGGKAPADLTTTVAVVEVPRPVFAFSVQVDDREGGNGDGLPQRGETFALRVDVRNAGPGASGEKTYVSLKNLGDEKLFITKGREVVGAMKPGEVRSATMQVELKRGSTSESLPVRVMVVDDRTDQYVAEDLDLPVAKDLPAPVPAKGAVRVQVAEAQLRSGASASTPLLAVARLGTVLTVQARAGEFYRVEWGKGRMAFLEAADAVQARPPRKAAPAVSELWQREPPRIAFTPDPLKGAPVMDGETLHLAGSATIPPSADPGARLRDVFVFVNDQKVFFKVQPDDAHASRLDFATDVPLKPGNNAIRVFAREDEEFYSSRSIVVYRRPPPALATEANRGAKPEERTNAQQ